MDSTTISRVLEQEGEGLEGNYSFTDSGERYHTEQGATNGVSFGPFSSTQTHSHTQDGTFPLIAPQPLALADYAAYVPLDNSQGKNLHGQGFAGGDAQGNPDPAGTAGGVGGSGGGLPGGGGDRRGFGPNGAAGDGQAGPGNAPMGREHDPRVGGTPLGATPDGTTWIASNIFVDDMHNDKSASALWLMNLIGQWAKQYGIKGISGLLFRNQNGQVQLGLNYQALHAIRQMLLDPNANIDPTLKEMLRRAYNGQTQSLIMVQDQQGNTAVLAREGWGNGDAEYARQNHPGAYYAQVAGHAISNGVLEVPSIIHDLTVRPAGWAMGFNVPTRSLSGRAIDHWVQNPTWEGGIRIVGNVATFGLLGLAEGFGRGVVTGDWTSVVQWGGGALGASAWLPLISSGIKDSPKMLQWAKGKWQQIKDFFRQNCFPPDTLVATEQGLRPIGTINAEDRVYSFDCQTGTWQLSAVEARHDSTYEGAIVTIDLGDTKVETTAYHPFWVIEGIRLDERPWPQHLAEREDRDQALPGRWVNSHELQAGDLIYTRTGPRRILRLEQRYEVTPVCNLTVRNLHTFAVGEGCVLVHNMSGTAKGKLDSLPGKKGKTGPIKEVPDHQALQELFDDITSNGKSVSPGTYPGIAKKLPDGTIVRMRPGSKSGGAAIDVTLPDGTIYKVHIK